MLLTREQRLDMFTDKEVTKSELEKELFFNNSDLHLSKVLKKIKVDNSDVIVIGEGELDIDFGFERKK